jgi:Flp pilus assembly protein TadD
MQEKTERSPSWRGTVRCPVRAPGRGDTAGVRPCAIGRTLAVLVLASLLLACSDHGEGQPASSAHSPGFTPDLGATALNNRGVGLMGMFRYDEAVELFSEVVDRYPEWSDARVNLAIATLNRQRDADEAAALEIVEAVLENDPGNLRANYVAGLLRLYLASPAEALVNFRAVAEADPNDPYAAYYLAQCLAQQGDYEPALEQYRRALQLDPYLRSAYYGAFQSLQRLKRPDEARSMISDYQRLANNPQARLAEFKYTRMGPRGNALASGQPEAARAPPPPEGPVFSPEQALPVTGTGEPLPVVAGASSPVSLTVTDIQDDGHPDLFVAGVAGKEGMHNLLLAGQADGTFTPVVDNPLTGVTEVNAALWGDYDNDGLTDVYLCRRGPNMLWRQAQTGQWENVTASTLTSGGTYDTVDGAIFDADHDGDLDLFLVNGDGPNELLSNNLDGTFRPLARERGIAGDGRASRSVLPVDIDHDRDLDIIVLNREPPHEVYLNDRLWSYRPAPGFDRFRASAALALVAGDLDADGAAELYTFAPQGQLLRWPTQTGAEAGPDVFANTGFSRPRWAQLAILDADGDGELEVLAVTPGGWVLGGSGGPQGDAHFPKAAPIAGSVPVVLAPQQGPALVVLTANGGLSFWPPGTGRYPSLAFTLTGLEDAAQSMRSNASGIGARIALRAGKRWTLTGTGPDDFSGPGQSLQPVSVGLGGAPQADFVTIDWPDGVFQSELDLESGGVHAISETQRQLSSCPVLFAWDGSGYAFISDLLGVGGIGYAVGPGEYAEPRPWENFLLPVGLPRPKSGRLALKITEPMEEVAYLDGARLLAYDLPPGWKMVLDERMATGGVAPTGRPVFYRRSEQPQQAVNERDEDVTSALLHSDGRAAPVGGIDRRFIGRLDHEHVLTLSFAQPLDAQAGEVVLAAEGWVEYPYSQTMFAAWQAGASYDPPTLEARGAEGVWHTLLTHFGYPAGMPRRMSVPLRDLPEGTTTLRLRSNMEIYWDRIEVVYEESPGDMRRQVLPLRLARLARTGFVARTTAAQRRPHYDYARRTPFLDTRYMAGYYTRPGPVDELLRDVDDAFVIIGPGDEVHLEFDAAAEPPPRGWRRYHVLEANGWAKDMDLYTLDGDRVGPLPSAGKPPGPRERLHAMYNTRFQSGR